MTMSQRFPPIDCVLQWWNISGRRALKIDDAIALIQAAHEQGHDVSEALTPLLLARLERGDDPNHRDR